MDHQSHANPYKSFTERIRITMNMNMNPPEPPQENPNHRYNILVDRVIAQNATIEEVAELAQLLSSNETNNHHHIKLFQKQ